jgi:hypothetical protein
VTDFVRIVNATGAIDGWGDIPASQVPLQARDGMTVLECGNDTVQRSVIDGRTFITVDLDWLKQALCASIDMRAGTFRTQFVTDAPAQSYIYAKKESEALSWIAGDHLINPDKYPFMIAEAYERGVDVEQIKTEITQRLETVTPIMALIEAKRISTKRTVEEASTIQQAISSSCVDFESVVYGN